MTSRELTDELMVRIAKEDWDSLLAQLETDHEPNARLREAVCLFARGSFTGDVYHSPDCA